MSTFGLFDDLVKKKSGVRTWVYPSARSSDHFELQDGVPLWVPYTYEGTYGDTTGTYTESSDTITTTGQWWDGTNQDADSSFWPTFKLKDGHLTYEWSGDCASPKHKIPSALFTIEELCLR